MNICKICKKEYSTIGGLLSHVSHSHHFTSKEYYDKYFKQHDEDKCVICGKPVKYVNFTSGYAKTCGINCGAVLGSVKSRQTKLEKYGDKNYNNSKKIISTKAAKSNEEKKLIVKKRQQTCLEKYGVDNPSKSTIIKEKIRKSNQQHFGVDWVQQDKDVKEKKEKTNLKKYGTVCPANFENQKKARETKLKNHGSSTYNNRDRAKKTCVDRYGVDNPFKSKEIQDKVHNTIITKYGSEKDFRKHVKNKVKNTIIEKYSNTDTFYKDISIRSRLTRHQLIDEYCTNFGYTKKEEIVEKYGYGWLFANIVNCVKYKNCLLVKNEDIEIIKTYSSLHTSNNYSCKEKKLVEYIKSIYFGKIIENDRKLISPKEVDIYIPDKNLAIEFNGVYWHSSLHNQDKFYHQCKSKLCEEKGVRLIHIYEWELETPYWEKLQMLLNQALGNNLTIYARNCEIKEISNKEAKALNENIHLQGHRNAQVTYGLFYNDRLVQLMSFSKTKYNKNLKGSNDWEIIRGCPGSNIVVVGGVSKLFKHFIKEHNPNKVFSYCDFNKFDGVSYEKLGMKFIGYTGPDKTWIVNGKPIKRNPKKYKELKTQAEAIMWGSGSKKYEWSK